MSLSVAVFAAILVFILWKVIGSLLLYSPSPFPVIQNTWSSFLSGRSQPPIELVQNAYKKYSKVTSIFRIRVTTGLAYVLPPSVLTEFAHLSQSVLDAESAHEQELNLKPVLGEDYTDIVCFVSRSLQGATPAMLPRLVETIHEAFKVEVEKASAAEGSRHISDYSSIVALPTSMNWIAAFISQVFIGDEYGRNEKWTTTVMDFSHGIMLYDIFLRWLPQTLRRYVSELTPTRRRVNRMREWLREDVLNLIKKDDVSVAKEMVGKEATSRLGLVLPMLVEHVQAKPQYQNVHDEELLKAVTARVAITLFAVVDTTSLTFSQVLFDLVSHPRATYADPIIAQIQHVLSENGGVWDLQSLNQLKLLDSFIKESQRLRPMLLTISGRNVLPPEGYTFRSSCKGSFDSQPLHVPQGARVELPVWGVHHDPDIYSDPETFDGFRFVQDSAPPGQLNDKFLAFGHGRHACPGRHFALILVKLMVIEILLNWDYKEIEKRPSDMLFGLHVIPNYNAKVSLRPVGAGDDTSVAILEKHDNPRHGEPGATLHFHEKITADNSTYKGVHPIVSLESHSKNLGALVRKSLGSLPLCDDEGPFKRPSSVVSQDGVFRRKPDFVSVTRGPGMRSNLACGLDTAKGLSVAWQIPLLGVHHMQAHALTPRLVSALQPATTRKQDNVTSRTPRFPFLSLLVSGGHTLLLHSQTLTSHRTLATTVDTAIGDCLDKIARDLLPASILTSHTNDTMYARLLSDWAFPAHTLASFSTTYTPPRTRGAEISKPPTAYGWALQLPYGETRELKFSFSGLASRVHKIATRQQNLSGHPPPSEAETHLLAQQALITAFEHLASRTVIALEQQQQQQQQNNDSADEAPDAIRTLVLSGGVAANLVLRVVMRRVLDARGFGHVALVFPPAELCTDNAAMVGWAGIEMWEDGWESELGVGPVRRWVMDEVEQGKQVEEHRAKDAGEFLGDREIGRGILGVGGWKRRGREGDSTRLG